MLNSLLINVRTELTNCTSFVFILSSLAAPNPGSADVVQPMRARKRSSLRIAIAFIRRTDTAHLSALHQNLKLESRANTIEETA